MEEGIKDLVNQAIRKNQDMTIDEKVENALLEWQKENGEESYLKFDNLRKMIKQIGGNAQFIAFLGHLKGIKDIYLQYYNIIDLTLHFPKEEKTTVNAKNILISMNQKISEAAATVNQLKAQFKELEEDPDTFVDLMTKYGCLNDTNRPHYEKSIMMLHQSGLNSKQTQTKRNLLRLQVN